MFFSKQLAIIILFSAITTSSSAAINFSLSASSGDKEFDLTLNNINTEAQRSMSGFYSSMRVNFGASSSQLDFLIGKGLSPADAFMVFRLSLMIGKPVETVLKTYTSSHKKGWGAMSKELGIKPGSPQFHQLKKGGIVVLEESRKQSGVSVNIQATKLSSEGKKQSGSKHNGKGNGKKK